MSGIAHTARPIFAAPAIMAAVFGCLLLADVLELKQFGLALAMAVILDATIVRLLLVPSVMKVAGKANWWLPRSFDRILPRIRVDGPRQRTSDTNSRGTGSSRRRCPDKRPSDRPRGNERHSTKPSAGVGALPGMVGRSSRPG